MAIQNLQIEVILVLDSEDDETHARVNEILVHFNMVSIKVVSGLFGSPGVARNAGMKVASAEWLAFWDFDDFIIPHRWIEMCVNASGCELAIGSYEVLNIADGSIKKQIILESETPLLIALNPGIWRMVFQRESLSNIQFSNFKMGEDQLFLVEYKFYEKKIYIHKDIVYRYVKGHPNQATLNRKLMADLLDINQRMKLMSKSVGPLGVSVINTMYIRQLCTLIIKAKLPVKVISVFRFVKFSVSWANLVFTIRTMRGIIRQK